MNADKKNDPQIAQISQIRTGRAESPDIVPWLPGSAGGSYSVQSVKLTMDLVARREDFFGRVGLRPMVTGVDLVTVCVSSRPCVARSDRGSSAWSTRVEARVGGRS